MTVKELKILLDKYPDEYKVAYPHHSDYVELTEKDVGIEEFVLKNTYMERFYYYQYLKESKPKTINVVTIG